jgi:hypothetical protein
MKAGGGIISDEVLAASAELDPNPPATHFFVEASG